MSLGQVVCCSSAMQRVYQLIHKASTCDCTVLILGESGTGKELVARALHESSSRKHSPYVPVDCASLVPTLMESELFGYERGSFTGAFASRPGLFSIVDDGTVLLDEIGELAPHLQGKLLRTLQEREFRPVGSVHVVPFRARVVAATHRDLSTQTTEGTFRADLFYRLNVLQIKVPALRERRSDIGLLANWFVAKSDEDYRSHHDISKEAMGRLISYDWPGNLRELENMMLRAVALSSGPVLESEDFFADGISACPDEPSSREGSMCLDDVYRSSLAEALRRSNGNRVEAARLLGIGKTTVYRWLKSWSDTGRRTVSP